MQKIKKDIESLFHEKCFVTEWQIQKQLSGETLLEEKEQKKELFCRICRNPKIAVQYGVLPMQSEYDAILLFSKENYIAPGSKIELQQQQGENIIFYCVGEMVPYDTHNEIALKKESVI